MSARALFQFVAQGENELAFEKGDMIQVIKRTDTGWSQGIIDSRKGWFPDEYVEFISASADVPPSTAPQPAPSSSSSSSSKSSSSKKSSSSSSSKKSSSKKSSSSASVRRTKKSSEPSESLASSTSSTPVTPTYSSTPPIAYPPGVVIPSDPSKPNPPASSPRSSSGSLSTTTTTPPLPTKPSGNLPIFSTPNTSSSSSSSSQAQLPSTLQRLAIDTLPHIQDRDPAHNAIFDFFFTEDKSKREAIRRRLLTSDQVTVHAGHVGMTTFPNLKNAYDGEKFPNESGSTSKLILFFLDQFEIVCEYKQRVALNEGIREKDPKLAAVLPTPPFNENSAASLQRFCANQSLEDMPFICNVMLQFLIKYDSTSASSLIQRSHSSTSSSSKNTPSFKSAKEFEQLREESAEFFIFETLELSFRLTYETHGPQGLLSIPWNIFELLFDRLGSTSTSPVRTKAGECIGHISIARLDKVSKHFLDKLLLCKGESQTRDYASFQRAIRYVRFDVLQVTTAEPTLHYLTNLMTFLEKLDRSVLQYEICKSLTVVFQRMIDEQNKDQPPEIVHQATIQICGGLESRFWNIYARLFAFVEKWASKKDRLRMPALNLMTLMVSHGNDAFVSQKSGDLLAIILKQLGKAEKVNVPNFLGFIQMYIQSLTPSFVKDFDSFFISQVKQIFPVILPKKGHSAPGERQVLTGILTGLFSKKIELMLDPFIELCLVSNDYAITQKAPILAAAGAISSDSPMSSIVREHATLRQKLSRLIDPYFNLFLDFDKQNQALSPVLNCFPQMSIESSSGELAQKIVVYTWHDDPETMTFSLNAIKRFITVDPCNHLLLILGRMASFLTNVISLPPDAVITNIQNICAIVDAFLPAFKTLSPPAGFFTQWADVQTQIEGLILLFFLQDDPKVWNSAIHLLSLLHTIKAPSASPTASIAQFFLETASDSTGAITCAPPSFPSPEFTPSCFPGLFLVLHPSNVKHFLGPIAWAWRELFSRWTPTSRLWLNHIYFLCNALHTPEDAPRLARILVKTLLNDEQPSIQLFSGHVIQYLSPIAAEAFLARLSEERAALLQDHSSKKSSGFSLGSRSQRKARDDPFNALHVVYYLSHLIDITPNEQFPGLLKGFLEVLECWLDSESQIDADRHLEYHLCVTKFCHRFSQLEGHRLSHSAEASTTSPFRSGALSTSMLHLVRTFYQPQASHEIQAAVVGTISCLIQCSNFTYEKVTTELLPMLVEMYSQGPHLHASVHNALTSYLQKYPAEISRFTRLSVPDSPGSLAYFSTIARLIESNPGHFLDAEQKGARAVFLAIHHNYSTNPRNRQVAGNLANVVGLLEDVLHPGFSLPDTSDCHRVVAVRLTAKYTEALASRAPSMSVFVLTELATYFADMNQDFKCYWLDQALPFIQQLPKLAEQSANSRSVHSLLRSLFDLSMLCNLTQRVQLQQAWRATVINGDVAALSIVIPFLLNNLVQHLDHGRYLDITRLAIMALTSTQHRAGVFSSLFSYLLHLSASPVDATQFVTAWLQPPSSADSAGSPVKPKTARRPGEMTSDGLKPSQASLSLWVDLAFSFEADWIPYLPALLLNALLLHPSIGVSFLKNLLQGITSVTPALTDRVKLLLRTLDAAAGVPLEDEDFIQTLFDLISQAYSGEITASVLELALEWGLQIQDDQIACAAYRLYRSLSRGGRHADLSAITLRLFAALSAGDISRVSILVDIIKSISRANPEDAALSQQLCIIGGLLLNTSLRTQYIHSVELLLSIQSDVLGRDFFLSWPEYDTQILPLLLLGMTHSATYAKTMQLLQHLVASHPVGSSSSSQDSLLLLLMLFASHDQNTTFARIRAQPASFPAGIVAALDERYEKLYSRDPQQYFNTILGPAIFACYPSRANFDFSLDVLIISLVCSEILIHKLLLIRLLQSLLMSYARFPIRNDQRRFLIDLIALYSQSTHSRILAQSAQTLVPYVVVLAGPDPPSAHTPPLAILNYLRAPFPSNFKVFVDNPLLFPGDERPNFFVRLFQSLSVFVHLILKVSSGSSANLISLLTEMFKTIEESYFQAIDSTDDSSASDSSSHHRKSIRLSKVIRQTEESTKSGTSSSSTGGSPSREASSRPRPSKAPPAAPSSSSTSSLPLPKPKAPPPTPPPKPSHI